MPSHPPSHYIIPFLLSAVFPDTPRISYVKSDYRLIYNLRGGRFPTLRVAPVRSMVSVYNSDMFTLIKFDLDGIRILENYAVEVLLDIHWQSKYQFQSLDLEFYNEELAIQPDLLRVARNDFGPKLSFAIYASLNVLFHEPLTAIILHIYRQSGVEYTVNIGGYLKVTKHYDELDYPTNLDLDDEIEDSSEPFEVVGYQTD